MVSYVQNISYNFASPFGSMNLCLPLIEEKLHLVLFCKKSLLAWSRLLLSRIDVLRLNVIPQLTTFAKILPPHHHQQQQCIIMTNISCNSCGGTNCSHYNHVKLAGPRFLLKLNHFFQFPLSSGSKSAQLHNCTMCTTAQLHNCACICGAHVVTLCWFQRWQ